MWIPLSGVVDELVNTLDAKYRINSASRAELMGHHVPVLMLKIGWSEAVKVLTCGYPEALSGVIFVLIGATGFLGASLIKDILDKETTKLIAHIRGAKDLNFAKDRLTRLPKGCCLWQDSWVDRIPGVLGDIAKLRFGLDDAS
ncbi:hypothetical protein NM208_g8999 [Fusarium decemcellulare]|uniref:Uncharacterized protein n=1 Tax=Fusarium decemcellulare TaxID=57161 RepID=A0ACC1S387_9HYPO|nr:hypothetical protein NM208_g8999 [Fusarium decemcellulare]